MRDDYRQLELLDLIGEKKKSTDLSIGAPKNDSEADITASESFPLNWAVTLPTDLINKIKADGLREAAVEVSKIKNSYDKQPIIEWLESRALRLLESS